MAVDMVGQVIYDAPCGQPCCYATTSHKRGHLRVGTISDIHAGSVRIEPEASGGVPVWRKAGQIVVISTGGAGKL